MRDLSQLRSAIEALETIQAELAGIARRDDSGRRNELVDLRRKLAAQIAEVGRATDPVFAGLGNAALLETYRARLSKMRSAAATHQAKWPAVLLGERPDEYRKSAQSVREANKEFVSWVRETLDMPRGNG